MLRVEPLQTPLRCRVPRLMTVGWETIPPMGAGSLSAHWLMDSLTQRSIENSAAGRLYPGCYPSTACVGAAKSKVRRCRIKLGQTPLCLIVAVVFCAVALFSQHAGVEVVDTRDVQVTWAGPGSQGTLGINTSGLAQWKSQHANVTLTTDCTTRGSATSLEACNGSRQGGQGQS
jgi:hypothetical protein